MTNLLLIALSAIESGHRDTAIGRHGEVSRYQMMPYVWRAHARGENPRDPEQAGAVAMRVMRSRYRGTDPATWYLAWHCPGRLRRGTCTRRDNELAARFTAIFQSITTQPVVFQLTTGSSNTLARPSLAARPSPAVAPRSQ